MATCEPAANGEKNGLSADRANGVYLRADWREGGRRTAAPRRRRATTPPCYTTTLRHAAAAPVDVTVSPLLLYFCSECHI
ncbi:hypothetical protein EYF80_028377 [Liparis tanakae]|uniref:Uncharacterized protein n=1 Tax=Liparis tanakae TaxID=230148 RepID=A0A4Z2H786_9TELE|nr:hypothetical protein EYF80_028377 [Liparis tanakae]